LPTPNDDHEGRQGRGVRPNGAAPSGRAGGGIVDLDVSWLVPADLSAVSALARLQLAASLRGRRLVLHGADGGLAELLDFVGLGDVVHRCGCCRPRGPHPPPRWDGP
jgi:ABC-type transporter Mla MlaB component